MFNQMQIPLGKENEPFVDNDILFVPDGELSQNGHVLDFGIPHLMESKKIEATTPVCFTSKALIGEKHFNELVDYYCISGKAEREYQATYPESFPATEILEDTNSYRIISVFDFKGKYSTITYKVNKQTFKIEEYNSELDFSNIQ